MGSLPQSNRTVFPSLEAFRKAKGLGGPARTENPLAKFYTRFPEEWVTGQIQDYDPHPLPVTVLVRDEPSARAHAHAGHRPLADADPEIKAMFIAFFDGKAKVPEPIARLIASEKAKARSEAAKPAPAK